MNEAFEPSVEYFKQFRIVFNAVSRLFAGQNQDMIYGFRLLLLSIFSFDVKMDSLLLSFFLRALGFSGAEKRQCLDITK